MPNRPFAARQTSYLSPWLEDYSDAQITSLGVSGGFSGAVIWRAQTSLGELCLRRWPQAHPTLTGLKAIHGLLKHVASAGNKLVPVPLNTRYSETHFVHEDHLWELTPWMPGESSLLSEPTPEKLSAAMQALAQFHQAARGYESAGKTDCVAPSPGLQQRLTMLQSLQQDELQQLWQATRTAQPSDLRELALELLEGIGRSLEMVVAQLQQIVEVPLPLQWCWCDVRHDHILFSGEEVTGLLDFGAVTVDSVAGDLARLLGSIVNDHPESWQQGLDAYEQHQELSPPERAAIVGFDQGGLLCAATNWVRWLYVEGRTFPQIHALHDQLLWLRDRLTTLAERSVASVSQPLSGPSWHRPESPSSASDRPQRPSSSPWMHS